MVGPPSRAYSRGPRQQHAGTTHKGPRQRTSRGLGWNSLLKQVTKTITRAPSKGKSAGRVRATFPGSRTNCGVQPHFNRRRSVNTRLKSPFSPVFSSQSTPTTTTSHLYPHKQPLAPSRTPSTRTHSCRLRTPPRPTTSYVHNNSPWL